MEQIGILRHAVEALDHMDVPYSVMGSFASIAYGESRFTQDGKRWHFSPATIWLDLMND
jgi:hypothetical protein